MASDVTSDEGSVARGGGNLLRAEDICEAEWAEWYSLSPAERWLESSRLWTTFFNLGGSLDPEPDTQSPFHDPGERSAKLAYGRPSLRVIRRSGV